MLRAARRGVALVVAACVTAMVGPACGDDSASSGPKPPVPKELQTIEDAAEDIIDIAPAKHWTNVSDDLDDIRTAWASLGSGVSKRGARDEWIAAMDTAIDGVDAGFRRRSTRLTMQRSNDVTKVAVELFGLYDSSRPLEIGRLDVIGRQIILDVDAAELASAGEQLAAAKNEWKAVRADIARHGGAKVVAKTSAVLEAMAAALVVADRPTLRERAQMLLELVDDMERLF